MLYSIRGGREVGVKRWMDVEEMDSRYRKKSLRPCAALRDRTGFGWVEGYRERASPDSCQMGR